MEMESPSILETINTSELVYGDMTVDGVSGPRSSRETLEASRISSLSLLRGSSISISDIQEKKKPKFFRIGSEFFKFDNLGGVKKLTQRDFERYDIDEPDVSDTSVLMSEEVSFLNTSRNRFYRGRNKSGKGKKRSNKSKGSKSKKRNDSFESRETVKGLRRKRIKHQKKRIGAVNTGLSKEKKEKILRSRGVRKLGVEGDYEKVKRYKKSANYVRKVYDKKNNVFERLNRNTLRVEEIRKSNIERAQTARQNLKKLRRYSNNHGKNWHIMEDHDEKVKRLVNEDYDKRKKEYLYRKRQGLSPEKIRRVKTPSMKPKSQAQTTERSKMRIKTKPKPEVPRFSLTERHRSNKKSNSPSHQYSSRTSSRGFNLNNQIKDMEITGQKVKKPNVPRFKFLDKARSKSRKSSPKKKEKTKEEKDKEWLEREKLRLAQIKNKKPSVPRFKFLNKARELVKKNKSASKGPAFTIEDVVSSLIKKRDQQLSSRLPEKQPKTEVKRSNSIKSKPKKSKHKFEDSIDIKESFVIANSRYSEDSSRFSPSKSPRKSKGGTAFRTPTNPKTKPDDKRQTMSVSQFLEDQPQKLQSLEEQLEEIESGEENLLVENQIFSTFFEEPEKENRSQEVVEIPEPSKEDSSKFSQARLIEGSLENMDVYDERRKNISFISNEEPCSLSKLQFKVNLNEQVSDTSSILTKRNEISEMHLTDIDQQPLEIKLGHFGKLIPKKGRFANKLILTQPGNVGECLAPLEVVKLSKGEKQPQEFDLEELKADIGKMIELKPPSSSQDQRNRIYSSRKTHSSRKRSTSSNPERSPTIAGIKNSPARSAKKMLEEFKIEEPDSPDRFMKTQIMVSKPTNEVLDKIDNFDPNKLKSIYLGVDPAEDIDHSENVSRISFVYDDDEEEFDPNDLDSRSRIESVSNQVLSDSKKLGNKLGQKFSNASSLLGVSEMDSFDPNDMISAQGDLTVSGKDDEGTR